MQTDKLSDERLITLKNEIDMAEALNKEELEPIIAESLQRYVGEFVPVFGGDWDIILNEVYPIIQSNLPSIFFRNPRAFLKPRNKTYIVKKRNPVSGQKEDTELDSALSAKTQEHILNYLLTEIKYKPEVRRVLLDALLFPHGVLWHGYKGDFGMTEEQSIFIKDETIFVKRISPLRFLKDPNVQISNIAEGKWVGRIIDIPLVDLVEDNRLDVDKQLIKGYKGFGDRVGSNSEKQYRQTGGKDSLVLSSIRKNLLDFTSKDFQESRAAKFVRLYELYLRPNKKEARDGSQGWILLLTNEQKKPLRINDWNIKAEGFPSHILQFNELPDAMFGLADVSTYKDVADQKNTVVNLQLRNAQENSKVWVALAKSGTAEEDIEHIRKGEQSIVMFEGDTVQGKMMVASGGGQASSELYLLDQRIQKNLEDKSGVTDLKRGFLQSGEESAASVKLRAAGGSARPAYRQDIMADFLKDSFTFLNQLSKQFIPYDKAVRIVGSLDLEWSEELSEEELQADVDVEIDVYSMLPENPEKELQELNSLLVMMFEGLRDPVIAQKIAQEGKVINLSPVIEQILLRMKIRNPDIFRNIKPEESQGFVSVQQIREARENVNASVRGAQIPFPPKPGDDHIAKLEVYTSIKALLDEAGQISDALNQLIQIQTALLEQEQQKQAAPGNKPRLKAPQMQVL